MTGDGQRRGARRDDGVSLSDERGLKNGFGKPLRNESAGDKGTCSRAPEDLGAALWHTVSPMLWSYDGLASGGSLYLLTAGARGKYGGTSHKKRSKIHEKHKFAFGSHQLQRRAGLRAGRLSRPREIQGLPGQGSVMANVRGILLNSYRRDSIKRVYCLYRVSTLG